MKNNYICNYFTTCIKLIEVMKQRKNNNKCQLLVLAMLLFVTIGSRASVSHTLSFSADSVNFSSKTIDNIVYSQINYNGFRNSGDVAMPSLPATYFTFSVPYDAYNFTVTATASGSESLTVPALAYPIQQPRSFNDTTQITTQPDSIVYNTNAFYPQNLGKIIGKGYIGGDNHFVTIAVFPIQYNPVTSQVAFHENITITLNYSTGGGLETLDQMPLTLNNEELRAKKITEVENIVVNPTDVAGNAPDEDISVSTYSFDEMVGYEYCIITSRELAPAFERLVTWKRQKGYSAGIVCMEDILSHIRFRNGDELSGINDDAGKLRQYLIYAHKFQDTKFVLLGGKEPHVPVRYAYVNHNLVNAPTDMYFSDVNGNWDSNQNSRYGEESDNVDYSTELYIGRLLCKNQEEVNNYIDKLLIYELNPGNGDSNYLMGAYTYDSNEIDYATPVIIDELNQLFRGVEVDKQRENGLPTGSEVLNKLNQNFGYITLHGHGSPDGVLLVDDAKISGDTIWYENYGIKALDGVQYWLSDEANSSLDCMTNKWYPNIQYSMSCVTMPYDTYTEGNTTYEMPLNYGESFTLGKDYGGVAFLGNTRPGLWGSDCGSYLEECFLKQILADTTKIGQAEANSKAIYNSPELNAGHWHRLIHNLLGDPEFDMWTYYPMPRVYTDATVDITRQDGYGIYVSTNGYRDCVVAVYNTNGVTYRQQFTGSICRFPNVSPNSMVTVYKKNIIPYLADVYMQRETISHPLYYLTTNAFLGHNVDGNRLAGDIIFANGANATIEASGDILITSGFIVQSGAIVNLKAKGTVTISGGTIKAGGTLNIEASEIETSASFIAEGGATLNFVEISE